MFSPYWPHPGHGLHDRLPGVIWCPSWSPLQTILPKLPQLQWVHFSFSWNKFQWLPLFEPYFFKYGFCPTIIALSGVLGRHADFRRFLHTHWLSISWSGAQESAVYQSAQGIIMHIKDWEVLHRKIKTSLKRMFYEVAPCYLFCLILWHMSPVVYAPIIIKYVLVRSTEFL